MEQLSYSIFRLLFSFFIKKTSKEHELRRIQKIVEKYAANFKEQYRQHIGKCIDD